MSSIILISVAVLFLTFIILYWLKGDDTDQTPLPPGPSRWECLKLFKNLLQNDTKMHVFIDDLYKKYGGIVTFKLPGTCLVFLSNAQVIRKLFTSVAYRDVTADRPPSFFKKQIARKGTDIILRDYDEVQMKLRRMVHKTVKLYGEGIQVFEEMVRSEIRLLEKSMTTDEGSTVKSFDIDTALTTSLIRIVYIFLTNETPENTEKVVEVVYKFDQALNKMFRLDFNLKLTLFPWLRFIPGPTKTFCDYFNSCSDAMKNIFLNPEMIKRLKEHKMGLLGVVCENQEHDKDMTEDTVQGILGNIITAGFLTTKGTLSGFFLLMLYYPEIQKRIQEEINNEIRDREPTIRDRPQMHYTNATILETLRFIRHVPFGVPHMNRVDIDIDDCRIPANSTLFTNYWSMAYSEKYWENPTEFSPERFLDVNGKILSVDHPNRQQFIPFGIGKRSCLGESFSKTRVFLYVTSLLQKFTFTKGEDPLPSIDSATWGNEITLLPGPFKCTVTRRLF